MEGVAMSSNSAGPSTASQASGSERRTVPRYSLIATAEVIEPVSEVRISGRISEISRKGVYVDILNPLPRGTRVNIRILRDQGTFVATGKVIYVQQGMGMGVAFLDVAEEQKNLLISWLAELTA